MNNLDVDQMYDILNIYLSLWYKIKEILIYFILLLYIPVAIAINWSLHIPNKFVVPNRPSGKLYAISKRNDGKNETNILGL